VIDKPKLKRFRSKYAEEMSDKDLPPKERCTKLGRVILIELIELTDSEYLKLYMQNNPVHDNDREKAMSIIK
jgi:succinate dehydrogenase flavin-adding protein (antitoxin of CptAB toxin-antitoxin module)